jgi:UDP-glucose 4-epimerase
VAAVERAPSVGFGAYVIAAPTPFARSDAEALKRDAAGVVAGYFPDAKALYEQRGWRLPESIGRVYDAGLAERELGFRCRTDFSAVLDALRTGAPLPFAHDPAYESPSATAAKF